MHNTHRGKRGALVFMASIVLLSLIGMSAFAGGTNEKGAISFSWWGNDDRATLTKNAIALFEKANPNITVETSYATIDAYLTKLKTQVAGGAAPDLFLLPTGDVRDYASRGVLTDITSYLGSTIRTKDIPRNVQGIGNVQGKAVGLPMGLTATALVYNPKIWKAAGVTPPAAGFTWDDMIAAGKAISTATNGQTVAISDFGGGFLAFESYLLQHGKMLFTDAGKVGFAAGDVEGFWTLTQKLVSGGAATPATVTTTIDESMQNSGLARGLTAAEFAAASQTPSYYATLGDGSVALAPLPTDTGVSGLYVGGTSIAAISAKSKNKEAAARLLDFLLNDPGAGTALGLTRGIPPNSAVYSSLIGALKPGDKLVYDYSQAVAAKLIPAPPLAPAGTSVLPAGFRKTYEKVMFGQLSIADAARQVVADFEQAIK
jgi:multiple sugar transport system substrate-binding protein